MSRYKKSVSVALGATISIAGLAVSLAPSTASAQVYRCSNGGAAYISDRPCNGAAVGKLGLVGPTERVRDASTPSYTPPIGKAPEHQAYMSAQCASLNDAVRTGPARGLTSSSMNDLQNEYRKKCQEEDYAAQQRLRQQQTAERNERQSQQMAQQAQQNAAATSREQCNELLRILAGKRRQFDSMSAGEKSDFQRFEANYNARCKG